MSSMYKPEFCNYVKNNHPPYVNYPEPWNLEYDGYAKIWYIKWKDLYLSEFEVSDKYSFFWKGYPGGFSSSHEPYWQQRSPKITFTPFKHVAFYVLKSELGNKFIDILADNMRIANDKISQ